jgi:hypothetical protein
MKIPGFTIEARSILRTVKVLSDGPLGAKRTHVMSRQRTAWPNSYHVSSLNERADLIKFDINDFTIRAMQCDPPPSRRAAEQSVLPDVASGVRRRSAAPKLSIGAMTETLNLMRKPPQNR